MKYLLHNIWLELIRSRTRKINICLVQLQLFFYEQIGKIDSRNDIVKLHTQPENNKKYIKIAKQNITASEANRISSGRDEESAKVFLGS